ncbi:MAG: sugar transferase [Cyanobacteria bacterium K_Offshore_0m_m2_072]|nr:sugar transferase [Cyanobacteria bacterium K_Offshore_0m_m2_072]
MRALKRGADLVFSALLLLLLAPLLLLLALAVRLDSPGPLLFRQQRVGLGGMTFSMLKFRSMVADAPLLGGYSTVPGDPRITRSGRWLRRFSLDELPQLLNVLRGDMSLVGPRPDVPAQRTGYSEEEWRQRHRVRPGITGLAQATVRSHARPGQRKDLDLRYVREQSLGLDLWILGQTLRQLLGKGSY